jgi:hypothetical protein
VQDGLEPDAMLVDGPQLDARLWEGGRDRTHERAQVLLEVDLGLRIGLHMTWSRLHPAGAKPS